MMHDLKPYPAYKNSDVSWLGNMPDHWQIVPHRTVFAEINKRDQSGEQMLSVTISKGVIRQTDLLSDSSKKDSSNEDRSKYKLACPDDLVYNKMRAWQGSIGVSDWQGIVSPAYIVMRSRKQQVPRYFHYLYRTPMFAKEAERWSYGITSDMWSLRPEHFKMIYTCLPSSAEQTAIVRYLDHVDRDIKKYIRVKQKLIKLLEEQKQAIIHQAVTRGLNSDVPMKPSGVEWLGDVPGHWKVCKIKRTCRILRGKFTHRPRNDPSLYDGSYPFIQTGDVARAEKTLDSYKQTLNNSGLSVSKMFPSGTLVMTIAANIGDVAILNFEACFPDSIVGFVPNSDIDRDYLYYIFRAMKSEMLKEAPVNTQGNLNVERIGSQRIAIPPISEQAKLVDRIENSIDDINLVVKAVKIELAFAKEYRTRLIADVVTGKVDVREIAATLPEIEESDINTQSVLKDVNNDVDNTELTKGDADAAS